MSPPDDLATAEPAAPGVGALLDATFGFFVWVAHLLIVYIAHAVSCQLGVGRTDMISPAALRTLLVAITLVLAAIVVLHALGRRRGFAEVPARQFRLFLTVGCDALALVAIAWQLLAIGLIRVCA